MAFPSHSSNNTQRLLGERDKIEDEIARLEMKLHQRKGSPGFRDDMEMVDSLKRILVALRNEHKVIMETLDHAISAIGTPEPSKRRRESFPPERAPLESLVRKVQIAVSSENDDSILAGHIVST